ncbi:hypothetical protein [Streptoalloteichus hindustanus]|nr:hypothetical protein [Streptoalloteichus hindustanus]
MTSRVESTLWSRYPGSTCLKSDVLTLELIEGGGVNVGSVLTLC